MKSRLSWSIRRELWENRSLYLAPLLVAGVFFAGFLISTISLASRIRAAADPVQQQRILQQPFRFAELVIMGATMVVGLFYSVDALYGERRDRSILFWKSVPVSDTVAVLAKAAIPLAVLPVVGFIVTAVLETIMLVPTGLVLAGSGSATPALWSALSPFQVWAVVLYHLVVVHSLWYAPFYGWILLASAWARRMPLLWAVLPPAGMAIVEKVAFNTSRFAEALGRRLAGGPGSDTVLNPASPHALMDLGFGAFLFRPGLWIGLAVTAAFLAAAVRIRRSQTPI